MIYEYEAKKLVMLDISSRVLRKPQVLKELKGTDEYRAFVDLSAAAYIDCSNYLLRKLPLESSVLKYLSAIDPKVQQTSESITYMEKLPEHLKLFTEDKETLYSGAYEAFFVRSP